MTLPTLTVAQRAEALEKASAARQRRAAIRQELKIVRSSFLKYLSLQKMMRRLPNCA